MEPGVVVIEVSHLAGTAPEELTVHLTRNCCQAGGPAVLRQSDERGCKGSKTAAFLADIIGI